MRRAGCTLLGASILVVVCSTAIADEVHDGVVIQAGDGKLVMTDLNGENQHTHVIPAGTRITCDTAACKLDDLAAGMLIMVSMRDDGRVLQVDAYTDNQVRDR